MLFAYQRHERVLGADQIPLALVYNKSILRRIPGLEKTKKRRRRVMQVQRAIYVYMHVYTVCEQ